MTIAERGEILDNIAELFPAKTLTDIPWLREWRL